jgi:hypothetical protein
MVIKIQRKKGTKIREKRTKNKRKLIFVRFSFFPPFLTKLTKNKICENRTGIK